MAEGRLGPEVTDYYLETAIGISAINTANTNDDNSTGLALVGSVWYVKNEIDIGVEAIVSMSPGIFVMGRYPVDQWSFSAGVGQVGYNVDTDFGDYYAKPLAVTFATDYQTEYGRITARLIQSSTNKSYTTLSESCGMIRPKHWEEEVCEIDATNSKVSNIRRVFMLGFQKDL